MPYLNSDALDDTPLFERVDGFRGGMDAYTRPISLPQDVSPLIQNMLPIDNNELVPRPGADVAGDLTAGSAIIQALTYYDRTDGNEMLVLVSNKLIRKYTGSTWSTVTGYQVNDATLMAEVVQAGDLLYFTDGVNPWRESSGATFTGFTSLGNGTGIAGDPPVGATIAVWHTHRMFASGVGTENDAIWVSKILECGADDWDHVYWKFRVGGGEGQAIKALAPMPDNWLAVLKEGSIYLVDVNPTAATAAEFNVALLTNQIGCVGKRAWCRFGNDILFLSRDGVRSLRRMSGVGGGQYEVVTPLSEPMQPYIERINWTYASRVAAHKYREYAFFAVPLDSATQPNYVLVWNGRLNSWAGFWTGWTPTCWATSRFSGIDKLNFGDSTGMVNQWKDANSIALDATYQDNSTDVSWKWRSRSMPFGEPISPKDGYFIEARFIESSGIVDLTVFYDSTEMFNQDIDLSPTQNQLPVDLPFDLALMEPSTGYVPLTGRGRFNEMYYELTGAGKPVRLRNTTAAAYADSIQNE